MLLVEVLMRRLIYTASVESLEMMSMQGKSRIHGFGISCSGGQDTAFSGIIVHIVGIRLSHDSVMT